MAEALFRKLAGGRVRDLRVASAGVSAGRGQWATPEAVSALRAEGVDLREFRSQPVTEALVSVSCA